MKEGQRFGPEQREIIASEFDRIMTDYKEFKKQVAVDNPQTQINTLENTARTKALNPIDQANWLEDYSRLLQKTQGLNADNAFKRAEEAFKKFSQEREVITKQKNKDKEPSAYMKRIMKIHDKNKKD